MKLSLFIPWAVFADFGKGMVRIMQLPLIGNNTMEHDMTLPFQP